MLVDVRGQLVATEPSFRTATAGSQQMDNQKSTGDNKTETIVSHTGTQQVATQWIHKTMLVDGQKLTGDNKTEITDSHTKINNYG